MCKNTGGGIGCYRIARIPYGVRTKRLGLWLYSRICFSRVEQRVQRRGDLIIANHWINLEFNVHSPILLRLSIGIELLDIQIHPRTSIFPMRIRPKGCILDRWKIDVSWPLCGELYKCHKGFSVFSGNSSTTRVFLSSFLLSYSLGWRSF